LTHKFRNTLNHAESSEDVKKFFSYTLQDLLGHVLGDGVSLHYEDIALAVGDACYTVSHRLQSQPAYVRAMADSDLGAIMRRFAESAQHRMRHLEGHPEKTQAKIRGH
jgi:hypothetical protein